jgi:uncharacterized protein with PIN domain
MECNGLFEKVNKALHQEEIPEKAYQYFDDFYQCKECHNFYWKGSHYEEMQKTIDRLFSC